MEAVFISGKVVCPIILTISTTTCSCFNLTNKFLRQIRTSLLRSETRQPAIYLTFPGMKTNGLWVIPKRKWSLFYCGCGKCVRTLRSRTQVTEVKHRGLYPVHVCTSSLLSSGSRGKSRRLTLRIVFFSGSLNGLGYGLRV